MSEENLENQEDQEAISGTENEPVANETLTEIESNTRRHFLIIGGVIVAVFLLILGYLYFEHKQTSPSATVQTADQTEVVVSVKAAKAEKLPIAKEISGIGNISAKEQSNVSASLSAQIKQMGLLKNQFVRQGEILAVLASQDLQTQKKEAQDALEEARLNLQTLQKVTIPQTDAQTEKDLADAKANVDNTRATFERRKDLYAKGGISLKELEASELGVKNAENALRLVRQNKQLNNSAVNPNSRAIAESKIKQAEDRIKTIEAQSALAEVRAPISGFVTDQFQFEGEYASAGTKLLTIANTAEVIVKANFADTVIANLQTGDSVTVFPTDTPDERMGGKITLISRSGDPTNRTVEVWANFGNERGILRINQSAQMVVSSQVTNNAVIVPLSAVTLDASNGAEGTVMTIDAESIAHETKVKIGLKNGDKIQITEGLSAGETVVIEGNYALPDGTKVEILKDDQTAPAEVKQ